MRRRRNADRSGKGLRHFSMKVCKKVEEKGTTTYNEVADELVEEVCFSFHKKKIIAQETLSYFSVYNLILIGCFNFFCFRKQMDNH